MRKLVLFWIAWALIWIFSMKIFMDLGFIAYQSTKWIIMGVIIDIAAAVTLTYYNILRYIGVLIFTGMLIANFSLVMAVCYFLSMLLLFITWKVFKG